MIFSNVTRGLNFPPRSIFKLNLLYGNLHHNRDKSVLVVADSLSTGSLSATLSAIKAASCLSDSVNVLVPGGKPAVDKTVGFLSKIQGVGKILSATGKEYEEGFSEPIAQLAAEIIKRDSISRVVAAHTFFGREFAPRLAALLDCFQVSDIVDISGDVLTRNMFAGNAVIKVRLNDDIKVLTIRQSSFEKAQSKESLDSLASIEEVQGSNIKSLKVLKNDEHSMNNQEGPELTSADIVITGGRSFGSKEKFMIVYNLAKKLNAAVGATRAAIDAGYAKSDTQVGQTGKIVAPKLYIALGISGAIQHISGMNDSKIVVAVNKDPEARIFKYSDYGLVQDIFQATPELIEKLKMEAI